MKMFRIEFILLFVLSHTLLLNAGNYNEDVLTIYSKMIPRFVVMSSQKEKIKTDIEICILRDKLDEVDAHLLIEKIESNYPSGLLNHPIKLIQTNYTNIQKCKSSQLAFMFNADDNHLHHAISFLQKHRILSLSYDMALLEKGADASLFIGRNVMPYRNIKATSSTNIFFDTLLLRVSKIYKEDEK